MSHLQCKWCLFVFNATFNSISVILWRSVLLVEETGVPGDNHRTAASHWQTLIYPRSPEGGEGILFYLCPSVCPSVQDIFRRIFLSSYRWQKSDIWLQASYRYTILWVAFLDPSDSYFLFADTVDFYSHWTYMLIFRRIFLSNYWWQKSDIWQSSRLTFYLTSPPGL